MQSTRLEKISRLVQKELSEIFRLETAKTHGVIISVSSVRVSSDLSVARVRLSVFPSERGEELLKNINANVRAVRAELAQRTRYQLRRTPELTFFLDDSLDYIEHIDSLLHPDKQ
ncbi:MAG: 30S ribosome-binding factor RbfA [Muribaculaceae bacterium]|nr:30S ribosome-binding factor RbfA [Muribaculaceae bacterium]MBR3101043.1 30S ribosome-binding factor RbfA [Muribaculaceae bacterium]